MFSRQFDPPQGSPEDKVALKKQLSKSFHEKDLAWLDDPAITVERTRLRPDQIDTEDQNSWAAHHEHKKVDKKRERIKDGHMKPIVAVNRPHKGPDNVFVMDGHHHEIAYSQLIGDHGDTDHKYLHGTMPAFQINVPRTNGPWDTLHDKQENNKDA